jgi:hypothetical protein
MKEKYDTYAYAITPEGIINYCYNENLLSIEEFISIENTAFFIAMKKRWHIFKKLETKNTVVLFSLN